MEMSPAAGKILGMLMAYAVSSLGLLLAYYNYRKRVLRADTIFTPLARAVIVSVVTIAIVGAVLTAVAASSAEGGLWHDLRFNLTGLVLPAAIVAVSILLTWMLFRHFSRHVGGDEPSGSDPGRDDR